ncbi:septum site-determining protein MinC [Methylocystis echinoides]|jgi:septum site-determining protein MinC|uniref:septum site-determining protein MinC n=1 Tax=Methylocystis echinoides TaxID=29468 RepID=UPI00343111DE
MTQSFAQHIRFRGLSFPLLALEPEAPVPDWIVRLDEYLARFPVSFAKKPIVVDVSKLSIGRADLMALVESLSRRRIRIIGLSGLDSSWASDDLPPILSCGRAPATVGKPGLATSSDGTSGAIAREEPLGFDETAETRNGPQAEQRRSSPDYAGAPAAVVAPLVVEEPVRSGQSIVCRNDVTVIGSVAWGSEVVAGGSIHIYGTARGRVMAGAYGDARARIFCRRLEAELIAVNGVYMTAEKIDANLVGQAVQVWLEDQKIRIARFD